MGHEIIRANEAFTRAISLEEGAQGKQSAGRVGRDARTAYGLVRMTIMGAQASDEGAKIVRLTPTRN
jgi:hypothetical protein